MPDDNILNDDRFKDIVKLVLDDEAIERDQAKSVVTQSAAPVKDNLPEWQIPESFKPLQPYCAKLLDVHPEFANNVFIIMQSEKENQHLKDIYETIKTTLDQYGLTALRADERYYAPHLWDNARTYMLCCQYAIVIVNGSATIGYHDVAVQYGFMTALNRPTMLLVKEGQIHSDITGTRVYSFNTYDLRSSIRTAVIEWLRAGLGLTASNIVQDESASEFDVFLAHNSQDKPEVRLIADALKQLGLKPWLDEEQIPPGRWFQDGIEQVDTKSTAIFIGPNGLGKWQAAELRIFISESVEAEFPVIPVLLPGVESIPNDLRFLRQLSWVQFKDTIDDPEALDNLYWGITGKRP